MSAGYVAASYVPLCQGTGTHWGQRNFVKQASQSSSEHNMTTYRNHTAPWPNMQAEIEKVRRRREERELERQQRELEQEQLARDRAVAEAVELEKKEDEVRKSSSSNNPLCTGPQTFR